MLKSFVVTMVAALVVAACATSPTGRTQLMIVSEESAIAASKEAYVETLRPLEQQGRVDNDPALKARVHRITGRLIAQAIKFRPETAQWDWSIKRAAPERQIYIDNLGRTFWISLVVMLWCVAIGYPIAYLIANSPARWSRFMIILETLQRHFTKT